MYRTDKQFMKNPATASSRIYVGNLADNVKPEDLDNQFSQHGRILGLVVQRGFGFVQYENDEQAQMAISKEHGVLFFGKKMNVKQAIDNANKGKQQGMTSNQNNQNRNMQNNQQQIQYQQPNQMNMNQNPNQQMNMNQNPNQQMNMNSNQQMNMNTNEQQRNMNVNHQQNLNQHSNFQSNQGNQGNNFPNNFQSNQANIQNQIMNQGKPDNNFSKADLQGSGPSPTKPPQAPCIKPAQKSPLPPIMGMDNLNQTHMGPKNMNDEHFNKRKRRGRAGGSMGGGGSMGSGSNRDFRGDYMDDMDSMYYEPPYGHAGPNMGLGPGPNMGPGPGSNMGPGPGPNMGPGTHNMGPMGSDRMGPDSYHGGPGDKPERNDCEIIVVSKALTEYAEYIEQRLKDLGLIVDLLFPNDDVPIGRVLANISSRGCLFAILVMPQNEDHRSLTLNILHGIPEEHRNMPVEDALVFITRNFDAYMRGDKICTDKDQITLSSKHPEHIQTIVNLLAENRQVASHYYDKLIMYLQEKRDLQFKYEVAEGLDTGIEPEAKSKQTELQNRIMNILNKKMDDVPSQSEPESFSKEEPAPLLADPSVQKALDSLMLGDMFKNLIS